MKCPSPKPRFKVPRDKVPSTKGQRIRETVAPYADVLIFMVTLLAANYFWKGTFIGDEDGEAVRWLGIDVTAPFDAMSRHVAGVVYWLLSLCRETVHMVNPYRFRFDSGSGTTIIWGCTGIKQAFIWFWLILTIRGHKAYPKLWLHKAWFIPFGWGCCYAFNILRIFLISLFIEYHPGWFEVLHDYVFKYLFYAMLFGLWVWFVDGIRGPVEKSVSAAEFSPTD